LRVQCTIAICCRKGFLRNLDNFNTDFEISKRVIAVECDGLNQLGSGDATGKCKTRSIGSPKYKNLKLKKKEEKKRRRELEALKYRKHSRALLGAGV